MTSAEPTAAHEADLGTATDEQWLDAHAKLTDLLAGTDFPAEELTFVWDPELPASSLIDPAEADHGPAYADPEATDGRP